MVAQRDCGELAIGKVDSEPFESSLREDDAGHVLALGESAQAGRTLPRHCSMVEIGRSQRSCRARRTLLVPRRAPAGKSSKRAGTFGDEHVGGRRAFEDGADFETGRIVAGQIFQTVHGHVDVPASSASSSSL
jgi:hypothetical protein